MKLITLNCHSLIEEDYEEKFSLFIGGICAERPDILALQEVNQTMGGPEVSPEELIQTGYIPPGGDTSPLPVRRDNHGFRCAKALSCQGLPLSWTWIPAKTGYGRYDEGLALFSSFPIKEAEGFYITGSHDYQNWRTRKAVLAALQLPEGLQYACCLHMGRWDDPQEPFSRQWRRLMDRLYPLSGYRIWLLGDFNAPSWRRKESLDLILEDGWLDTFASGQDASCGSIREGWTVSEGIDGWWDQGQAPEGMRIDYIFTNQPACVSSSRVIFTPKLYGTVSDHRAVAVKIQNNVTKGDI